MVRKTNEEQIKTLLKNIAFLRNQNSLSKKEMACLLGVGIKSLNKIENGELPLRLGVDILFCIEKHFGIPCKNQFAEITGDDTNRK